MASHAAPVRLARVDDAGSLAQLLHDFNAEYDEQMPEVSVLAERYREHLESDAMWALVADHPDTAATDSRTSGASAAVPVGFASIAMRRSPYYAGPVAYLEDLYVRADLRGRGIGSVMINALWDHARERGVGNVEVNVDEEDVDALRFYQRHGFIYRRPPHDERGFYLNREIGQ
jgi:GNAT superfamily N-acetyltransferase